MDGPRKNPATAFFLSFIPGVGHLYAGRVGAGLGWLAVIFFLYANIPGLAMILHFFCAASAASAAGDANKAELDEVGSRRESAADVARMLDRVSHAPAAAAPAAPAPADPPPRLMRAAFPVPPENLLQALADAMAAQGLLVLGVDRQHLRVRGSADLGGGSFTTAVAQVEGTPSGSRVRVLVDRPAGSPMDPARDDAILRGLLERAERNLAATAAVAGSALGPGTGTTIGAGESLTEDLFLDQLREAWESFDQGWLPEEEWLQRKRSLVRSVTLRAGTRLSDFMSACRPLVEGGVLDPEDLRALEHSLGR